MQISEMYKKRRDNLEWRKFLLFASGINLNFLSVKNQLSISVVGKRIPCDVITYVNSDFITFACASFVQYTYLNFRVYLYVS